MRTPNWANVRVWEIEEDIIMAFKIVLAVVLALHLTGGVVQHRSLEDARLERQHLTHKYIKLLNKEEGAIRLVGGDNEYEGGLPSINPLTHIL